MEWSTVRKRSEGATHMSKTSKKHIEWKDLHPRAEQLLQGAGINQPEDIQIAHRQDVPAC
jgi:hypothetical protein